MSAIVSDPAFVSKSDAATGWRVISPGMLRSIVTWIISGSGTHDSPASPASGIS